MDQKSIAPERFSWRPRLAEGGQLKSLSLVEALEADIRAGRVAPGARLPPQRAIAEALGVDLTTVTRAFNEARRRGLVDAKAGRGTFVRRLVEGGGAELHAAPAVDLSLNIPPQPAAARLQHLIPETIADLLSTEQGMLHLRYQESSGSIPDRAAGSIWLRDRIADVKPSSVLLASGAQSALFAVCDCLVRPGETIAAGFVTYPGVTAIAQQRGYVLDPVVMDEDGIIPDSFEDRCRHAAPKALYLIPAIDNPTTATLPEARRRKIVAIARRHSVAIIEDDPYSSLLKDAPVSFAKLAPELTWHIATLSKCATPALRIAYVAAPSDAQALRLAGVLRAMNLMAPPLNAALASRWITTGRLDEIRNAIRDEAAARQKIARSLLGRFEYAADPHGHHLWLRMPPHWRATDLADHAERAGFAVVPSSAFAISDAHPEAVRISLGVAADRESLLKALKLLSELLAQPVLPSKAIV
ncbi:GntR family transcriptional regulator [Hyphomicrobium denitrificans 1NES1]|uniref:GntR family transcriptional regulator n=1 Tax=Hyphomicrobium denitrificans 1NES1 TaxID=670307 RepID=N0B9A4_9HYPH|nr:PLP-dependent aminotransferase family protein [Hyphomicrobium denitrificans]AGK56645.1 GntR family transcriptional regulator [Hyphomicrobium denitrificans 1NES1]